MQKCPVRIQSMKVVNSTYEIFKEIILQQRIIPNRIRFNAIVPLICGLFLLSCSTQNLSVLESPDGGLQILFSNSDKNQINVIFKGDTIFSHSDIGLSVEGEDLTKKGTPKVKSRKTVDEFWNPVNGKKPVVRNYYNEYQVSFAQPDFTSNSYEIIFRLYNDGWAYRYYFPSEDSGNVFLINKELTKLNFKDDFTFWAYNGENHNLGPLKRSASTNSNIRIPLVLKMDSGTCMAIHEAAIIDSPPFSINASANDFSLFFNTSYSKREKPYKTSWRAFIIGSNPGSLVESDLLVNLNEPCKIEDVSWIKPGKAVWDWRVKGYMADDGFIYGQNTKSHKRFIDFASENNIQYLIIDADWYGSEFSETADPTSAAEGVDIEECMGYARQKNIGIILYLNDLGAKKFGLEQTLKQFSQWGAVGVKYGFMAGSWEEKVEQTQKVVKLCAKYKLMVDFHDNPVPPNGENRTWPNLIAKEFCHAQTDAKRSYYPETAVNSSFINMIAGPLDATNGWFDLNNAHLREKVFEEIPGTVVAEVAKLIVVYTGWMVLPDSPEEYLKKDDLFDCIRKMPAQFDGFKVIGGEIDSFITVARKSGEDWFVGSLTNREAREINIDFSFLPEGEHYIATFYEDSANTHFQTNKESYVIRKNIDINAKSVISVKMAPGGGHAIFLQKKKI